MTSLTGRKRVLKRAATLSSVAAIGLLLLAGPALADPSKPSPRPSNLPKGGVVKTPSSAPTSAPEAPDAPGTTSEGATDQPTPPPGEPRFQVIPSPGVTTCEDLGLGETLMKVNGARKDHVQDGDGVSGVVRDTDIDKDGDPDSLYVTIDPGIVVSAVVYMHGNRGHIYESEFAPGSHGAFLAPPRSNNTEPPVNHWLICGPTSSTTPSPTGSVSPTDSQSPGVPPTASVTPSTPPGGSLPVTGLALTGVVLTGLGMVGAGVGLRALRRRNGTADAEPEEVESDGDKPKDV